jgi:hypothetical protein
MTRSVGRAEQKTLLFAFVAYKCTDICSLDKHECIDEVHTSMNYLRAIELNNRPKRKCIAKLLQALYKYLLLPVGAECDGQEQKVLYQNTAYDSHPKALITRYLHTIN